MSRPKTADELLEELRPGRAAPGVAAPGELS
jgi:hypothetical protein